MMMPHHTYPSITPTNCDLLVLPKKGAFIKMLFIWKKKLLIKNWQNEKPEAYQEHSWTHIIRNKKNCPYSSPISHSNPKVLCFSDI